MFMHILCLQPWRSATVCVKIKRKKWILFVLLLSLSVSSVSYVTQLLSLRKKESDGESRREGGEQRKRVRCM